jgi:hypothetical protein
MLTLFCQYEGDKLAFSIPSLGGVRLDVKWQGGAYTATNLLDPTLPRPEAGIALGHCS